MAGKNRDAAANMDRWRHLTWDDLEEWAGSRSLEKGRSYQRSGQVRDLARSADGVLVAWVHGTERYATQVELKSGPDERVRPSSCCTCPLGIDGCKHGVAVVLAYLESIKRGESIPVADAEDRRWRRLRDATAEGADDFDSDAEDEDGEDEDETPALRRHKRSANASQPPRIAKGKASPNLSGYLEGLPTADLARYILELAGRYPEVARELKNRAALASGKTDELVRQARKEIRRLTSEPAWYNHWNGEGELPDYGDLKSRFEQLLAAGQADALLELGETLFESGHEQVGSSHDEGETASGIADCLSIVFQAVPASSRPDARKLLSVIDMTLRDDYDICHGADSVLDRDWPREAWSEVADELAGRLRRLPKPSGDNFHERYQRDRLVDWLIDCFSHAGRDAEILPLCEAEARITGSYERLVSHLIGAGRLDDARRWAQEGIARTEKAWPGIARQLREHLRQLSERAGDWSTVAAFHAEEFFKHPSLHSLNELQQAADKAGCGPKVRAAALRFLETGVVPTAASIARTKAPARRKTAAVPSSWPLPIPENSILAAKAGAEEKPHFDVLLGLALEEKQPEDVLRWYDRLTEGKRSRSFGWYGDDSLHGEVADAVAATHPDRARTLYQQIIEQHIARTSPSAYEAARPYLRKLRDLLHRLNRDAEWSHYLAQLRETNRRKRRLLEVLDRLDNRRIVDS